MRNRKERKMLTIPLAWTLVSLALIPLAIIILTHLITLQNFSKTFLWLSDHVEAAAFEYLALIFVAALIYAFSRRLWVAYAVPGVLYMALTLISYYKNTINGEPLLLRDFTLASQFSEILNFALPQIVFSFHTVISLLLFLLIGAGLYILNIHIRKVKYLRPILSGISAVCIIVFLFTPLFSNWAINMSSELSSEEERIAEYGAGLGLYCTYVQNQKNIEMLSSIPVDELYEQIDSIDTENTEGTEKTDPDPLPSVTPTPEVTQLPHVIFLMSESFFDVTQLPLVSFSEDPIPVFHSLAHKHTSGDFISNTYSGGTGYVEMEVLTGICSNLLNEADTLTSLSPDDIYNQIPSITDVFLDYGYRLSFVHSYNSNLYNREAIYSAFGFDDILFDKDFSKDAEIRGGYISDMALSEKIISLYEENNGGPTFTFAVSMENHQPYTADKFGHNTEIDISSTVLSDIELAQLGSYVNGLNDADAALGRLVEYFSEKDEPVMIVFFGDHLPNLKVSETDTIYTKLGYSSTSATTDWNTDELLRMLSTNYVIWSNYENDIPADKSESCNTLGLTVLKRLGFELKGYYAWLNKFVAPSTLIYRPRLYVDSQGNAYSSVPPEDKAAIDRYALAVYDIVYNGNSVFKVSRNNKEEE